MSSVSGACVKIAQQECMDMVLLNKQALSKKTIL
jgi:hypothetical protein